MKDIDKEADLTGSNTEDEVLPVSKPAGLPTRPSDPTAYLRNGKGGSCMPPTLSPAHVGLSDTSLTPTLSVKGGLDLSGESEEYVTEEDGSRSLVEREKHMAEVQSTIDFQYDQRIARETALKEAQKKYNDYLTVLEETNDDINKRKSTSLRVLLISGVLALALTVTLIVLGGF